MLLLIHRNARPGYAHTRMCITVAYNSGARMKIYWGPSRVEARQRNSIGHSQRDMHLMLETVCSPFLQRPLAKLQGNTARACLTIIILCNQRVASFFFFFLYNARKKARKEMKASIILTSQPDSVLFPLLAMDGRGERKPSVSITINAVYVATEPRIRISEPTLMLHATCQLIIVN